ncbi:1-acyl-sn-glycerol-3-phosphate acyltransferase [Actinomycetaceae bacterium TAE3-ERU4]|nr:1-acyl-sn-glycerol-3-phosphate acyltransferase [Actinomycetaceae bacterium TAE3-ERU4]
MNADYASLRVTRRSVAFLNPLYRLICRPIFCGLEKLPQNEPYLVVCNHLSSFDGVSMVFFFWKAGVHIRLVGKHTAFKFPVIGRFLSALGHIPIHRDSPQAKTIVDTCARHLSQGDIVGLYPEGTTTRQKQYWPMTFKTGAARIALRTGCKIVPVVSWGNQQFFPRYSFIPRFWRRPKMIFRALDPVETKQWSKCFPDYTEDALARELSDHLCGLITSALAKERGEEPPEKTFDLRIEKDPWLEKSTWKLALEDLPELRRQRRLKR